MIDRGLLATVALVALVVAFLDRWLRRRGTPKEPISALASTPLIAGIAAARLTAVLLDDPATLLRPFDLLLIRGGMEFWPGVVAATAAIWAAVRRRPTAAVERLAELVPFALFAYAVYEAACVLRDGCFGPPSPVGLRPGGLGRPQLPVGILVGMAAAALGALAWRWSGRRQPGPVVVLSLTGLAAIRSVAGFALPKLATGLTRPHWESLTAVGVGLLCTAVMCRRSWRGVCRRPRWAGPARSSA